MRPLISTKKGALKRRGVLDVNILQKFIYPLHIREKEKKIKQELYYKSSKLPLEPIIHYANDLQKLHAKPSNFMYFEEEVERALKQKNVDAALHTFSFVNEFCADQLLRFLKSIRSHDCCLNSNNADLMCGWISASLTSFILSSKSFKFTGSVGIIFDLMLEFESLTKESYVSKVLKIIDENMNRMISITG